MAVSCAVAIGMILMTLMIRRNAESYGKEGLSMNIAKTDIRSDGDLREQLRRVRAEARQLLDRQEGRASRRLTLTYALIIVTVAALGLYLALQGLYLAGYLLFGEPLWLTVTADFLLALGILLLVCPLAVSVWRMTCRMTASPRDPVPLWELFYPFSSPRSYGRTLAVLGEALLGAVLLFAVPVVGYRALDLLVTTYLDPGFLRGLLRCAAVLACLLWSAAMLLLSGKRAGIGYTVFTREDLTLGDAYRLFRSLRRPLIPILLLRLSQVGWAAVTLAAVLIPLIPHTVPYTMLCTAVYTRGLHGTRSPICNYDIESLEEIS